MNKDQLVLDLGSDSQNDTIDSLDSLFSDSETYSISLDGLLGNISNVYVSNWSAMNDSDLIWGATNSSTLEVHGDAKFDGDIVVQGKSLLDTLSRIEEKLAILRPNSELESKWDELRKIREQYQTLEKEIIEKEKVWRTLQK